MKISFLLFLLLYIRGSSSFNRHHCCHLAVSSEACNDNCLELYRTKDVKYREQLRSKLADRCPPNHPDLEDFWKCHGSVRTHSETGRVLLMSYLEPTSTLPTHRITIDGGRVHDGDVIADDFIGSLLSINTLQDESAWIGSKCCEFAVDPICRTSCIKIGSMDGITKNCSVGSESEFWDCIFRQRTKNRCCKRHGGLSTDCVERCNVAFHSSSGPSTRMIEDLGASCSNKMASCMNSYRKKVKSNQSNYCCRKATDADCRSSCMDIYRQNTDPEDIAEKLNEACGAIILYQPFWACLMSGESLENQDGGSDRVGRHNLVTPFVTQVQCCHKAFSDNCRDDCLQLYAAVNPDRERWKVFEKVCRNSPNEYELRHCLAESQVPCKVGCDNLEFCTNFNNRPTALFRSCNRDNDLKAKSLYQEWRTKGLMQIPTFANIPFHPVDECEPDKWKAIACTINIQPCSSYTGEFNICKSDCLDLMRNCVDDSKHDNIDIHEICEKLTVNYQSSSKCIHLSTYTKPAPLTTSSKPAYVRPCNVSTCSKNEICLVNRDRCADCERHICVPGCPLSTGSEVVIPHGHLVRLPLDPQQTCFRSAICDADIGGRNRFPEMRYYQSSRDCDVNRKKSCTVDGMIKLHVETFEVDCNFCACYNGNVICTKRKCRPQDASACDCSTTPTCGEAESCYDCAQWCLAKEKAAMLTCDSNPCQRLERCVRTPRVCLTYGIDGMCPQYECMPRHKRCKKLMKNAILQHEGSFFRNPLHRYKKYENIMSSSFFFSNLQVVKPSHNVCDATGKTYQDICSLVDQKSHNIFAYRGSCEGCSHDKDEPVCGYDQITYDNGCVATSSGALPQYRGPCEKEVNCSNVQCLQDASSECELIHPPGACCPICAAMFRVLFDRNTMRNFSQQQQQQKAWKGPVTVNDVITQLQRFVDIYECKLFGYLTDEDDLAVLITPHETSSSHVLVKACRSEAERITQLITRQHPTITSDLVLSSLIASRLHTIPRSGSSSSSTQTWSRGVALSLSIAMFIVFFLT